MPGCKAIAFLRADLTSDPGQHFLTAFLHFPESRWLDSGCWAWSSVLQYLCEVGLLPALCSVASSVLLPTSQGPYEDSAS